MRDEDIINLYLSRSEDAIFETEEKYGAYCKTVAKNILNNKEDSEECFNTTLLKVWNSVPPQKPRNFKIYLAKITRNTAINKLKEKAAQKRGNDEKSEIFEELSECIKSKENVEKEFEEKEFFESINSFAKNLSEKERNIFIRRYFFLEETEEISQRYGYSKNRVSVILFRVRKKLHLYLEKEGFI